MCSCDEKEDCSGEQRAAHSLKEKRVMCSDVRIFPSVPHQVSSPRVWRSGTCDREVCIPQKRVRMPHSSQETEGWLSKRHPVHMEVRQDGGHVLPDAGLWRLGSRQRKFLDASEVGVVNTANVQNNSEYIMHFNSKSAECLGFLTPALTFYQDCVGEQGACRTRWEM